MIPPSANRGTEGRPGAFGAARGFLRQVVVGHCVARNLGLTIRLVAGEHANVAQPARFQPRQEIAPTLRRLGEAVGALDRLAVAVLVHAYGDYDGDVLVGSAPAALQVDAIDVYVRVFAGQRPAPLLVGRVGRVFFVLRSRRFALSLSPCSIGVSRFRNRPVRAIRIAFSRSSLQSEPPCSRFCGKEQRTWRGR